MTFTKHRMRAMVVAAASSALVITGCSFNDDPEGDSAPAESDKVVTEIRELLPESILKSGRINVVSDPSQAPYEFVNDDDEIVGINPDLAAEVAAILGVELEWSRTDFAGLITGVKSKRYDIMIEAMWDTEKRQAEMDFVDNLVSANNIVVPAGNPENIQDLPDLCGREVSTLEGSMMVELFEEYQAKCGDRPIKVSIAPTTADQLLWLSTGRAEATIANPIVTQFSLDQGTAKNIEVVPGEGYLKNNYGWGVNKENTGLRDAVAAALQHLIDTGAYDKVMDKWKVSENSRLKAIEINSEPVA